MRFPPRAWVIGFVIAAFAGGVAVAGGCANKPPRAESAPAASGSVSASASGESTSAAGSATSGGGASADNSSARPAGSALPVARAQTSDERRAALDKRLNDSLGSFDAKVRSEQQKIAQERDARQATVAAAATPDDGAGKSSGTEQSGDAAGRATTESSDRPAGARSGANSKRGESRSARAGDLKSDKAAGGASGNAAGNGAVANEIPDGSDDDIVARRLRKAAEQETDPELKDKLWKEYVEYKKNTQPAAAAGK